MHSTQGELSPEKMLKQAQRTKGYLYKKSSGLLGGWDRRYFIITNGAMIYYPDETLEKAKGTILLKNVEAIIIKKENEFMLETGKRNFQFKCERESERDLWVASLNILKEFSNENGASKTFIIKSEKNQNQNTMVKQQNMRKMKDLLGQLKLSYLQEKLEEPRIYNRICFCRDEKYSYFSISIKSLTSPEDDEELLNQKYIKPFEFNKFYRVEASGQIQDFGKVSQMLSFKTSDSSLVITLSDKRKICIPYEDEGHLHEISQKLSRNYDVAKEYYNQFKIILKKNVDRLVFLYENHPQIFKEQVKYRGSESLKRYKNECSQPVKMFLEDLNKVKRNLIETEDALKVMNPPREKVKSSFFIIYHTIVYQELSQAWESIHHQFELNDYLKLSSEIYEYWVVTSSVVGDKKLLEGCTDLNKFYLRKHADKIKNQIQSINYSKLKPQGKKAKNEPLSNEITHTFFEWLKEFTQSLSETVPVESVFDQFCKFFNKSFEELTEYLMGVSDKWSDTHILLGACNDISRIKEFFSKKVGSELCKGIVAETRFHNTCTNNIVSKLNDTISHLIRRIFIVVFGSIDKKILNRTFLEIDIAKICYQVLQRLEPFKNKVIEEVDNEIILLSFDEICFFFYTCLMKKKVFQLKNLKELCIAAINKALTELEQYYCNIKTESKVKQHLSEYLLLKEILACPESQFLNYAIQLRQIFGISFNEESIYTVLKIRQVNEEVFERLYHQCCESIKHVGSSEDSMSREDNDHHNRSRKSTLTESAIDNYMTEMVTFSKQGREGYLVLKKFVKGIPVCFSESFFRVKQSKILQYNSLNSFEVISSINLQKIDRVYLENNGDSTFIVAIGSDKYSFTAPTRDQAGRWIQSIYSEIGQPLYETKAMNITKDTRDCLFKNFDAELTTTATMKIKPENEEEEKILEQKRLRRLKDVNKESSPEKKDAPRKKEKLIKPIDSPRKIKNPKKEDEGSCCSKNFF